MRRIERREIRCTDDRFRIDACIVCGQVAHVEIEETSAVLACHADLICHADAELEEDLTRHSKEVVVFADELVDIAGALEASAQDSATIPDRQDGAATLRPFSSRGSSMNTSLGHRRDPHRRSLRRSRGWLSSESAPEPEGWMPAGRADK